MLIGQRLRELRESRKLSQGDLEKRTGLLRCYISRPENGHTVPNVVTLEKCARALEIPLYRLFCDGTIPPAKIVLPREQRLEWGRRAGEVSELRRLARLLGRMSLQDQRLLIKTARLMAKRQTAK